MRVDVGQVGGVGEVAVEEAREEEGLDLWWEKVGDDVEACLPSGQCLWAVVLMLKAMGKYKMYLRFEIKGQDVDRSEY